MAYANHRSEVCVGEGGAAQHQGELVGDAGLEGSLDGGEGVGSGGLTNTQAVVAECCVALLNSIIDVGVSRSKVPVEAIKANTVSQELHRAGHGAIGRHTQCGCNGVVARNRLHASHDLLHEGRALSDELEESVGDFRLVLGQVEVELDVLSRSLHGNIAGDTDGGASARGLNGRVGEASGVWCTKTGGNGTTEVGGVVSGGQAGESE